LCLTGLLSLIYVERRWLVTTVCALYPGFIEFKNHISMTVTTTESNAAARPRVRQPQATTDLLRSRIRSGEYKVGDRLPTQRELTEDLHIHRRIVRAALAQLEKEGLLSPRRNSPPVITAAPKSLNAPLPLSNLVALVIHHGGPDERQGSAEQQIFWGVNQALSKAGYHAVFLDLSGTESLTEAETDAVHLQYVIDKGFGGVIFYSYSRDKNRDLIRKASQCMPMVLIDRMPFGIDLDFAGMQNKQAMHDATKFLLDLGHRRIAFASTSDTVSAGIYRQQGYLDALREAPYGPLPEILISSQLVDGFWPMFDLVFSQPADKRPTAILCVNDFVASQAARRLESLNLTIPGDVSIVGCDNVIEKLPNGVGLTTIEQPFGEIGKEAARLFLRRVAEPDSLPLHIELPANLIIRESTKAVTSE